MVTIDPPLAGPCVHWATPEDLATIAALDINDLDPDLLDANLTVATEVLYRKSGSMWPGTCAETVRPVCRRWLSNQGDWWTQWGYPYIPELVDGMWFNAGPGQCAECLTYDSGLAIPRIDLGRYPVVGVLVGIDGVVLDPAAYRIDEWRYLTRIDGLRWPVPNNLLLDDSQPGTWSVEVAYGMMPPTLGRTACAILAAELTKHMLPGEKCSLPLRVTTVSRQGITYSMADVMDLLEKNRTGLYVVDLFLQTVNPNNLDRPARVLTPDIRGPRRVG